MSTTPDTDDELCATDEVCPMCGGKLLDGYGLMGGGVGAYKLCDNDACDFFVKRQDGETTDE